MLDLTVATTNAKTMTSKEISEVTGKMHKNIIVDVEKLNAVYAELGELKCQPTSYRDASNRLSKCYALTQMQCLDLITGYNTELRIKINRRWAELEAKEQNTKDTPIALLYEGRRTRFLDVLTRNGKFGCQLQIMARELKYEPYALIDLYKLAYKECRTPEQRNSFTASVTNSISENRDSYKDANDSTTFNGALYDHYKEILGDYIKGVEKRFVKRRITTLTK